MYRYFQAEQTRGGDGGLNEKLELIVDAKADLAEGPCWDRERKVLYWVDIVGKKVHMYDPNQLQSRTIEVGQYVGAVVPRKSGGLMLAMHHGFYSLDLETEALVPIADPEREKENNRFNDGKCDASGRFWAGTMELDGKKGEGSLYCLDRNLDVRTVLQNVSISNGLGWSPDHKTMYYIDTPTRQVAAFDYDLDTGTISNKRTVVSIPEGDGDPDGMTVDEEGMIWVAHWGGSRVSRWNPSTGECLEEIPVPASQVTSCAFGGDHLDELYITTARLGLGQNDRLNEPHAGGLFRIKVNVRGLPSHPFAG